MTPVFFNDDGIPNTGFNLGDPIGGTVLGNTLSVLANQQKAGLPIDGQSITNAMTGWFNQQADGQHGSSAAGIIPFVTGGNLTFETARPEPLKIGEVFKPGGEPQQVSVGLNGINISQGEGNDLRSLSIGTQGQINFNKPGFGLGLNLNPQSPSFSVGGNAFGGSMNVSAGYQQLANNTYPLLSGLTNAQPGINPVGSGGWVNIGFSTRPMPEPIAMGPEVEQIKLETEAQRFLAEQIAPLVDQYKNNPTSFFR